MTRGDLCVVLFGFAPVTATQLAHVAHVSVEEIEAFYRSLRMEGLVDFDEATGFWFRVREMPMTTFIARVIALGIDVRQPLGISIDQPRS